MTLAVLANVEPDYLRSYPDSTVYCCATFSTSLDFAVPQFPYL